MCWCVKSTTTHARYIINLFTHSFFIYTKQKNSRKRWDIWQKDRILWVWSLPTTVSSTSNAENSVFEWKCVCVCVCLNTCCDQEIKGRRPLLSPSSCFFSFSSRWEIVNSPCYYSVFTPMELLNILNLWVLLNGIKVWSKSTNIFNIVRNIHRNKTIRINCFDVFISLTNHTLLDYQIFYTE